MATNIKIVKYKAKRLKYENHDVHVSIRTKSGRVMDMNFQGEVTLSVVAKKIKKQKGRDGFKDIGLRG